MLANRSSVWLNLICVFFSPYMTQHQPVSSSLRNSGFAFSGHMGRGWESWGCLCWRGEGGRGTVPVCTDTWWGEWRRGSQALLSGAQRPGSGLAEMQEIPFKRKECFFPLWGWSNREAGCGISILGDIRNPTAGHPACCGWPSSEQGAGPDELWRCLPTSALLWKKKYCSLEWRRCKTSQFLQSVKIAFFQQWYSQ